MGEISSEAPCCGHIAAVDRLFQNSKKILKAPKTEVRNVDNVNADYPGVVIIQGGHMLKWHPAL